MWIRDNENGEVRQYGTNHHDALAIAPDGRCLYYENLQNGDGSRGGGYSFVTDEKGNTPINDEELMEYGAKAYFDIGGFKHIRHEGYEQAKTDIMEKLEAIEADFTAKHPDFETTDDKYVIAVMTTLKVCKEAVEETAKQPHSDTKTVDG